MARIRRVVAAGLPHHITQRGNRRQQTFFREEDYEEYIHLMSEWCKKCQVEIWSYCLMPNHIHLIAVPSSVESMRKAIGEAHRRYTRYVNFYKNWRGYLWQGRFASYPMDESYLLAAARYIEFNPVRAGIVENPIDYRWSSARAHIDGKDDLLVKVSPLLGIVGNWQDFLSEEISDEEVNALHRHERSGRPLGNENFIDSLEKRLERILRPQKRGPKQKID